VVAAVFIPIHLFLFGLAFPLGWLPQPSYEHLLGSGAIPARENVFVCPVVRLPLFHWAHRFRFTVYDGLQVKHLNELYSFSATVEQCWDVGERVCAVENVGER